MFSLYNKSVLNACRHFKKLWNVLIRDLWHLTYVFRMGNHPSITSMSLFVYTGGFAFWKNKSPWSLISIENSSLFCEWHWTTILISDSTDATSSYTHNSMMTRTKIPIEEAKPPSTPTKTFCRCAVTWTWATRCFWSRKNGFESLAWGRAMVTLSHGGDGLGK